MPPPRTISSIQQVVNTGGITRIANTPPTFKSVTRLPFAVQSSVEYENPMQAITIPSETQMSTEIAITNVPVINKQCKLWDFVANFACYYFHVIQTSTSF